MQSLQFRVKVDDKEGVMRSNYSNMGARNTRARFFWALAVLDCALVANVLCTLLGTVA